MMESALSNSGESKNSNVQYGGYIAEGFYISSLARQGFTFPHCLGELYANSIDAGSKRVKIVREKINDKDTIRLSDNGKGMNDNGLLKFAGFQEQNHLNEKSLGISGIGGKAALFNLGQKNWSYIISSTDGENIYTSEFPWKKIIDESKLTNNIIIRYSTDIEKHIFKKDREGNDKTGATLILPYSLKLAENINNIVAKPKNIKPENRLDILYGTFNIPIEFKDAIQNKNYNLDLTYNYFGGENNEYLIPTEQIDRFRTESIEIYKNKSTKEIKYNLVNHKGEWWDIPRRGGGWSKKPAKTGDKSENYAYEHIESVKLFHGLRNCPDYWKKDSIWIPNSASSCLTEYDKQFFEPCKETEEFLIKLKIKRNDQVLAPRLYKSENIITSARANAEARLVGQVQSYLEYETYGKQDENYLDEFFDVQQTKQAQSEGDLPVPFERLCVYARKEYATDLLKMMHKSSEDNMRNKHNKAFENFAQANDIPLDELAIEDLLPEYYATSGESKLKNKLTLAHWLQWEPEEPEEPEPAPEEPEPEPEEPEPEPEEPEPAPEEPEPAPEEPEPEPEPEPSTFENEAQDWCMSQLELLYPHFNVNVTVSFTRNNLELGPHADGDWNYA